MAYQRRPTAGQAENAKGAGGRKLVLAITFHQIYYHHYPYRPRILPANRN